MTEAGCRFIPFQVIAPAFCGELAEFHRVVDLRVLTPGSNRAPAHQAGQVSGLAEVEVNRTSSSLEAHDEAHGASVSPTWPRGKRRRTGRPQRTIGLRVFRAALCGRNHHQRPRRYERLSTAAGACPPGNQVQRSMRQETFNVRTSFRTGGNRVNGVTGLEPVLKMGGAGDPPAPVGDPPAGTAASKLPKRPCPSPRTVAPVPFGASPDGTDGSPVLPANHFSNTLKGKCKATEWLDYRMPRPDDESIVRTQPLFPSVHQKEDSIKLIRILGLMFCCPGL